MAVASCGASLLLGPFVGVIMLVCIMLSMSTSMLVLICGSARHRGDIDDIDGWSCAHMFTVATGASGSGLINGPNFFTHEKVHTHSSSLRFIDCAGDSTGPSRRNSSSVIPLLLVILKQLKNFNDGEKWENYKY